MSIGRTRIPQWESLRRRASAVAKQQLAEVRSAAAGLGRVQTTLLLLGASTVAYGGVQMLQILLERTAPLLGVGGWWPVSYTHLSLLCRPGTRAVREGRQDPDPDLHDPADADLA